ncbi:low temperature-induced protein [Aerosakkonema sp. BLCC-F183]|uniref:low temperature-induced protein n=1 Tax=Aerosakkonema sp. BLCC-F183 TaxID=3342834 RepID=UPI0035B88B48
MRSIRFNFSALLRPIRVLLAVCVCAVILMSYAMPAYSASTNTSRPTDGEANLLDIERKSQEAVLSNPYGMKKQIKETNPGLNEVQGTADIDKMKRPENTKGVESVEEIIGKSLEKAAGNK